MDLSKIFSTKVDSQNAHEMPNFKYPLSTEKWMIFYNERRPLLMKCFKTFLKCMRQMGGASLCILLLLMVLIELCFTKVESHKLYKIPYVGYALSVPKWLVVLKGEHRLLTKCFKVILRCMQAMGGALDSIYLSIMGPTEPFSTKVGSQIACKQKAIFWIPSQYRRYP